MRLFFRNNKRVAEIWLDDYKKYFYARNPERYKNLEVDIGDISVQLALKQKLKCKPFSYFLEEIAPDMLDRFPLVDNDDFASGTIRNKVIGKCIQTTDHDHGSLVSLAVCSHNKTNPVHQQHFMLRYYRDIMIHGKSDCLEGSEQSLTYARCHYEQGNQYFRFDVDTLQLYWGRKRHNLCVDADPKTLKVFIEQCDLEKETQKWIWGFSRVSSLRKWIDFGAKILDENEIADLKPQLFIVPKDNQNLSEEKIDEGCDARRDGKNDDIEAKEIDAQEVKPQVLPAKPQIVPPELKAVPQAPQVVPQAPPQVLKVVPEVLKDVPQAVPQAPKAVPQAPQVPPQVPQAVPQAPQAQVPNAVPQNQSNKPPAASQAPPQILQVPQAPPQVPQAVPQAEPQAPQVPPPAPLALPPAPLALPQAPQAVPQPPQGQVPKAVPQAPQVPSPAPLALPPVSLALPKASQAVPQPPQTQAQVPKVVPQNQPIQPPAALPQA